MSRPTANRILDAAMDAFGSRGYDGTSLDDLARELGIRKQTILYWYPSKEALLEAVVDRCAEEVARRLVRALEQAGDGFGRVEAMVRAMFRLAARHPSMLGFLREVTRLGPPASNRLLDHLSPLIHRASAFLEAEMAAGRMRRHDPRLLLLAAYSMVTGMATEVDVLRAFGEEPTLRSLVHRRDELLSLLRAALEPGPPDRVREQVGRC
jgi:AcrR family transcriptional regulator